MKRLGLAVASALLLTSCASTQLPPPPQANDDGEMEVVATAYPLHEALAAVGGERVESTHLRPLDGRSNEPLTEQERQRLLDAALVVVPGRGVQPVIEDLLKARTRPTVRILEDVQFDLATVDGGAVEPAVWLDPANQGRIIDKVRAALLVIDPAGARLYDKNLKKHRRTISGLDQRIARRLAACERRTILTAGPEFGHFTRRYGLDEVSIPRENLGGGAIPVSDAATTAFVSDLPDTEEAERIRASLGVRVAVLDDLFDRTDLARRGGAAYVSTMRLNLDALTAALGCEELSGGK